MARMKNTNGNSENSRRGNRSRNSENNFIEVTLKGYTLRVYNFNDTDFRFSGTLTLPCDFAIRVNIVYSEKKDNFFYSFPTYKNNKGEYKELVFPITKIAHDELYELLDAFLAEYDKSKSK